MPLATVFLDAAHSRFCLQNAPKQSSDIAVWVENSLHLNTFYRLTTRKHVFVHFYISIFTLLYSQIWQKLHKIQHFETHPNSVDSEKPCLKQFKKAHFEQLPASKITPNQCFHFLKRWNQGNSRASDHVFQTFKTWILPSESTVETLKISLLTILAESWTGRSRSYFF